MLSFCWDTHSVPRNWSTRYKAVSVWATRDYCDWGSSRTQPHSHDQPDRLIIQPEPTTGYTEVSSQSPECGADIALRRVWFVGSDSLACRPEAAVSIMGLFNADCFLDRAPLDTALQQLHAIRIAAPRVLRRLMLRFPPWWTGVDRCSRLMPERREVPAK